MSRFRRFCRVTRRQKSKNLCSWHPVHMSKRPTFSLPCLLQCWTPTINISALFAPSRCAADWFSSRLNGICCLSSWRQCNRFNLATSMQRPDRRVGLPRKSHPKINPCLNLRDTLYSPSRLSATNYQAECEEDLSCWSIATLCGNWSKASQRRLL